MPSYWDANGNLVDGRYEITGRTTKTIQTHNAVSVGPSGFSVQGIGSNWIDCNGFSDISLTFINDAATTSQVNVQWSNDNATTHGQDYGVVASSTNAQKAGTTKVKARYAKVSAFNGDTASHTMSAWAYLSA